MGVTHKAKAGALLTGTEYEAADSHDVSLTASDVGAEDAGAVAAHEAAADPHTGYRKESDDHTHASTGLQGGQISHADLTSVSADQHHAQDHAHSGTGTQKLTQANTHQSPDTDSATSSLHHTIGTSSTQAAAGNHTHTGNAPDSVDYLVGTASAGLSGEIVVGTSPGGELGGTWASPTVDATHSGSAHHAETGAPLQVVPLQGLSHASFATVGSANNAIFVPTYIPGPCTVTGIRVNIGTSSGNICVGLYNRSGARVATSGSVASPGTGLQTISFTGGGYVAAAGAYYLAVSASNNTVTFSGHPGTTNTIPGNGFSMGTAHPLPDPLTTGGEITNNANIPNLIGVVSGGWP